MLSKSKIKLINSLKRKKYRQINRLFTAEGSKLVLELLNSDFRVKMLVALKSYIESVQAESARQGEGLLKNAAEVIAVSDNELKKVSSLTAPQKVLAVAEIPDRKIDNAEIKNGLSLALDDIRDPGNLGSIIRTADWFGIRNVFCSQTCVDVYNPKVIQSTMGAITRIKVHYTELAQLLDKWSTKSNYEIYGSFLKGENIYGASLTNRGMLVLGNESRGISASLKPYISRSLYIPHRGRTESLNVAAAAAVICSEFRRRE